MIKWWKNSTRKFISIFTCFIVLCIFFTNGFVVDAALGTGDDGLDFYVPYSKPEGDGVGYISLVLLRDGVYSLETWSWHIAPYDAMTDFETHYGDGIAIAYFEDNKFTLEIANGTETGFIVSTVLLSYYSNSGSYAGTTNTEVRQYGLINPSDAWSTSLNYASYNMEIVGFECNGVVQIAEHDLDTVVLPRIHWGGDMSNYYLYEIMLSLARTENALTLYLPNLNQMQFTLTRIRELLVDIKGEITDSEQTIVDNFEQNSGQQSEELDSLNQQTQVDKIDVDSASQTIDENLNIQTDANYGVLLSTFTSNDRILTMLLLVASVSLISFVLFGKR